MFKITLAGATITLCLSQICLGAGATAFVGGRLIDGSGRPAIENGVMVIQDGRIRAIGPAATLKAPANAAIVDMKGKTVIPGLINAHGHVGETVGLKGGADTYSAENVTRQLALYASYGVTTVFSLGGDKEPSFRLREEQNVPSLKRARIYVAGTIVTATTPGEARKQVDEVAASRSDIVKIRLDDQLGTVKKMTPDVYAAVIDEAHKKNMRVAVHLYYLDDAKAVLKLGADFIAHSVRDRDIDAETIAMMRARDVPYCPTLTRELSTFVYESVPPFFSDPFFLRGVDAKVLDQLGEPQRQKEMHDSVSTQTYKAHLEIAKRNLKKVSDSGVRVVMGTDTGPPARFQGYFEHLELQMMVEAGLTPMKALVAATSSPATAMRLGGQVGVLATGDWADFLVLGKNPLEKIGNTETLESVWIAGNKL